MVYQRFVSQCRKINEWVGDLLLNTDCFRKGNESFISVVSASADFVGKNKFYLILQTITER